MRLTLWGTRGSLASAGPDTVRYGGDTSSVELLGPGGEVLVLDAGSGVRRLGQHLDPDTERVDVLLTHLHMDHIQGLGFFGPMFDPSVEIHLWGPVSTTMALRERLVRYLSPPLFPVRLRDLPDVRLHDVSPPARFAIGGLEVWADLVTHPGPTLGYRIEGSTGSIAYLPDHEPALGAQIFPESPAWTSGFDLATGVDILIHDAQYTDDEYPARQGWGHSSTTQTLEFAALTEVGTLVTFHHDPDHSDDMLDALAEEARSVGPLPFRLVPGTTGLSIEAGSRAA